MRQITGLGIVGDAPTDATGVTGILATWLSSLSADDVPAHIRERAAHLVLDGVACALVGAHLPWSRLAAEAVTSLEGTGSSPVLGWGAGLPAPAACLLNGTFIQGFELDDYHPDAPLHSLSLVLPSAVATVGDVGACSGRDFLTAIIAGLEVGPRVGRALHGGEMLSRGWHSGAIFGTHASAATAGWLRGLTAAQFEDALGLAATQSAGLMAAQYEAMSKRMHHGFSSRNGYYAAGLAARGYTGIKRVYERQYGGFLATFGEGHDPDAGMIVDGLGERWETSGIAVKAYAAMAGTHAPIDCILALRSRGLRAEDVATVDIWVSHAVYHHGWWSPQQPLETIGAQMNVGYTVAAALLDGGVLAAQFTRERIDSQELWDILRRVDVHHEPAYDVSGANFLTARVVVVTHDGRTLRAEVDGPKGGTTHPLSNAEIAAKARSLTADLMTPAEWQQIVDTVLGLDDLDDVSTLIGMIGWPVPALPIEL
jgi:2-methylcitrate dehydratase PrpD